MEMIKESDLKILYSAEEIQKRILELGSELNDVYKDEDLYLICVLKGSVMFMTDLAKHLKMPVRMEFIKISSYGSGFTSSGKVNAIDLDLSDLNDKNVLIVEDVVDTGRTARFLLDYIKNGFKPKTLKFCSLMDKKCKREVDVEADFYCFEVDNKFLVGYGLDFDGYYRNIPYVGYVEGV